MLILVERPASHPKFPENGLPYRGSPFYWEYGDPGRSPYSQENETRVLYSREYGDPGSPFSHDTGTIYTSNELKCA